MKVADVIVPATALQPASMVGGAIVIEIVTAIVIVTEIVVVTAIVIGIAAAGAMGTKVVGAIAVGIGIAKIVGVGNVSGAGCSIRRARILTRITTTTRTARTATTPGIATVYTRAQTMRGADRPTIPNAHTSTKMAGAVSFRSSAVPLLIELLIAMAFCADMKKVSSTGKITLPATSFTGEYSSLLVSKKPIAAISDVARTEIGSVARNQVAKDAC